MTVERRPSIIDIIETHKEHHPDPKVVVEGDIFLINTYERNWLGVAVSELLGNCLRKKGVTTVKITIEDGRLVVEDDVIHEDPDEILLNLNSDKPKTEKKDRPGGAGIYNLRKILGWRDGKLEYHADNGRIIAVATWVE